MATSCELPGAVVLPVENNGVVTRATPDESKLETGPAPDRWPTRLSDRDPESRNGADGEPRTYRSVWLSDIHLGTRGCKASYLLHFLRNTRTKHLYLVGDIIDGWALKRNWYWDSTHNQVVRHILKASTRGTYVSLVCGNHDEFLRDFTAFDFGGVRITLEDEHVLADGRRLLLTHGDRFDVVIRNARWLALLGDWAYTFSLWLNDLFNGIRRRLGRPYWSLSQYLKQRVKKAVSYIDDFERAVGRDARERGYDGVVCGHIHKAALTKEEDGFLYMNCGDWVESCTALVEHLDGRLELLEFAIAHDLQAPPPSTQVAELERS
jgi:UDP-2,3-diacylglucosamine pyrophosphatase LpxH